MILDTPQMKELSAATPLLASAVRVPWAVGVILEDRSAGGVCYCGCLRVITCGTPASEVPGVRWRHGKRDAPALPAGQKAAVADGLAACIHRRLLGGSLAGS